MDIGRISGWLHDAASERTRTDVRSIKGVRGVPPGDLAKVIARCWREQRPKLPRDEDALEELFGTAWEDGITAIGLLASVALDAPEDALEIGLGWCAWIDDVASADALGWYVLGPTTLRLGRFPHDQLGESERPWARRAAVMSVMAYTPTPVEGPAAAALRERHASKDLQFVDTAMSAQIEPVADAFVRDEDPHVRKALRRVLGAWALHDPDAAEAWLAGVRGGVAKLLREELEKSARKGRRIVKEAP
jgi:hypothetical protein